MTMEFLIDNLLKEVRRELETRLKNDAYIKELAHVHKHRDVAENFFAADCEHQERIAMALERIAGVLEKMNAKDPKTTH